MGPKFGVGGIHASDILNDGGFRGLGGRNGHGHGDAVIPPALEGPGLKFRWSDKGKTVGGALNPGPQLGQLPFQGRDAVALLDPKLPGILYLALALGRGHRHGQDGDLIDEPRNERPPYRAGL